AIEAVPGVRAVAPVLGAQLYVVRGDSAGESLFTAGVDPGTQMLYVLDEGSEPGPGEAVVSAPLAEAYGLSVGDTLPLAADLDLSLGRPREAHPFRVSGVGDFLYDAAGQRSLAIHLEEARRLTRRPDEVSLFAVAAGPGVDEE